MIMLNNSVLLSLCAQVPEYISAIEVYYYYYLDHEILGQIMTFDYDEHIVML